jgi:hypothetical protein
MEDIETAPLAEKKDEEEKEEEEFVEELERLSFDDIVSFTMLLETAVTLFSILIFFFFFIL